VEQRADSSARAFLTMWRWALLHVAVVTVPVAGFYLGLAGVPVLEVLVDACRLALAALGLPWSLLVSEALGQVDKENEVLGPLRELVLFLPAFFNVAVHVFLAQLGRRPWPTSPPDRAVT
jgi:hypothetical protein